MDDEAAAIPGAPAELDPGDSATSGPEPTSDLMRIITLTSSALFGVVILVLTVAVVATYVQNIARFNEWNGQLEEHSLPDGAILIDSGTRYGKLWGLGAHCDGEMWVVLSGEMSKEQIQEHYVDITNAVVRRESSASRTWRVTALRTHIGPAGLDLRCH